MKHYFKGITLEQQYSKTKTQKIKYVETKNIFNLKKNTTFYYEYSETEKHT